MNPAKRERFIEEALQKYLKAVRKANADYDLAYKNARTDLSDAAKKYCAEWGWISTAGK